MHRLNAAIPWLYAVLALIFGLLLATTTPPFQMADETVHFQRADALTFGPGGFETQVVAGAPHVTAKAHEAIADLDRRLSRLKFHPDEKVLAADVEPSRDRLDARIGRFLPGQAFDPVLYAPAAAAVAWGRHFGWTVIDTLHLARPLNLAATVALGVVALSLAGGARLPIFAILMLPMAVAVSSAVSQDGPLLGLAAVVVAIASRAMAADRPLRRGESLTAAVAVALITMAKLPYAVLGVLLILAPAEDRRTNILAGGAALIFGGAWNAWLSASGWPSPAPPGLATGGADQVAFLLGHPGQIPQILATTFDRLGEKYFEQMVGILGWLDTPLAPSFYRRAGGVLVLALATPVALGLSTGWRWIRLAAPVLALGGAAAVSLALYIAWSPTGAPMIEGVQGRYFLPLALMLPLALEGPRPLLAGDRLRNGLRGLLTATVVAFPIYSLVVTEQAIIARYYLS